MIRMLKLHPSVIASSFRVDENVGDCFCFDLGNEMLRLYIHRAVFSNEYLKSQGIPRH